MTVPPQPKIYHICHMDRLRSMVDDGHLWCDAELARRSIAGTTIGMANIKQRRMSELRLKSYPDLFVGSCVPFNFCPRSVMLFLLHRGNHPDLTYCGGQEPIVHLEADLHATVKWAESQNRRWAFTRSNAGSRYFEDCSDLNALSDLDWRAIAARDWQSCKEEKQAEFLVEQLFPWHLVERIGVRSLRVQRHVADVLENISHQPLLQIKPEWYY